MKTLLKEESGFTLVELMVVVAIIGILSAIAVPNFKKYQAKSKQAEAKIQMAALYSAEVATSADYNTFGTCMSMMGYDTPPKGYYVVGFNAGYNASTQFASCDASQAFKILPTTQLGAVSANIPTAISTGTAVATQTTFIASAEASISSTVTKDIWTINDSKSMSNPTIGY